MSLSITRISSSLLSKELGVYTAAGASLVIGVDSFSMMCCLQESPGHEVCLKELCGLSSPPTSS